MKRRDGTQDVETLDPLSPAEASQYLKLRRFSVSPRTLDRMCKRGELNAFVTAGGWQRIRRSELDRWVSEHK